MSKFIGSRIDLGIGRETTRGTAVAPGYWLRPSSVSLDEMVIRSNDESTRNLIEDSIDSQVVGQFAEGEFELPIRDRSFGLLLYSLFGGVSSAVKGGESIVYEHTYTVQQSNQHPSLTVHLKEANAAKDYALAMLTSMDLSVELESHAMATFGFRSKKGATGSRTPSYISENIFLPIHGEVKFANDLSGLNAASAIKIRSFSMNINKNAEDDRALGNLGPEDIVNKQFAVEGEIELVYDDQTYVNNMLNNTTQALRIDLTNSSVSIGTSSNPKLRFELAKVLLSEVSRNFEKGDIVVQTLSFKGFYSETDSLLIRSILTNLVASYTS